MQFALDYGKMIPLDAEALAEGGIKKAYDSLVRHLRQHAPEVAEIQELFDNDAPSYVVRCRGLEYLIYSPATPEKEGQSWGKATHALFKIINDQLTNSDYRLYAIHGGNDLGGMFLTHGECAEARRSLRRKEDWPYLPTLEHPWYGQLHS